MNPWTASEILLLTELSQSFGKDFRRYIAHLPGRSQSSIKNQFYNLVVRKKIAIPAVKRQNLHSGHSIDLSLENDVFI